MNAFTLITFQIFPLVLSMLAHTTRRIFVLCLMRVQRIVILMVYTMTDSWLLLLHILSLLLHSVLRKSRLRVAILVLVLL